MTDGKRLPMTDAELETMVYLASGQTSEEEQLAKSAASEILRLRAKVKAMREIVMAANACPVEPVLILEAIENHFTPDMLEDE